MSKTIRTTRLAPSPTGTLHLGNARTFLVNWALARQRGWRIILRIEDLDRPRVRPGAAEEALQLLNWLGVDFDEGPIFQSHDLQPYREALRRLAERKSAYACELTRKQALAAISAPNSSESERPLPTQLRPTDPSAYSLVRDDVNYRFVVDESTIQIDDRFAGESIHKPWHEGGDFIIWTRIGVPAYQLAVVVDDARQGVTDVVRGDDLIPSAARQTLLYRALGWPTPEWWHLPMVFATGGQRLAKRNNDSHLATYRAAGVNPERVIGLLAVWCGVATTRVEMPAADFRRRFQPDTLSKAPITFSQDDHAWLLDGT